ncbi:hypothetical protein [Leptospirillum ferriphilum]|uniref:hypothetical protein n=1 Tax=Leptospirillum ferriphilum TaxID=178606 RepID=UPI000ABECE9A|nr:hypothetical protein [Leptospirillum ferriphilum]
MAPSPIQPPTPPKPPQAPPPPTVGTVMPAGNAALKTAASRASKRLRTQGLLSKTIAGAPKVRQPKDVSRRVATPASFEDPNSSLYL